MINYLLTSHSLEFFELEKKKESKREREREIEIPQFFFSNESQAGFSRPDAML